MYGLKEGLNLVKIKVTSEDNSQVLEYVIKVTKTENFDLANTNLETLAIQEGLLTPPFDNQIVDYEVEISDNITSLRLLAVPENENAKVEITGNDDLKVGKNQINIAVTAQNGETKRIYKIIAYKRNTEEQANYEKEQEEQKEKLKEAYNPKKVSANSNENNSTIPSREVRSRNYLIILAVVSLIVIIISAIVYIIRRKISK